VQGAFPPGPVRRRKSFGEARPITGSLTAPEIACHSLGRAARRCCHLVAVRAPNRLPTRSPPGSAHDQAHLKASSVDTIPGKELTPDDHLAVIPRHLSCRALRKREHPKVRGSRMVATNVAAGDDRIEAGARAIGDAQLRTDPSAGGPKSKTSNTGRRTPGAPAAAAGRSPMVLGTSCTVNPMLDRNARLVPIDY
jgi:hypothetical protein